MLPQESCEVSSKKESLSYLTLGYSNGVIEGYWNTPEKGVDWLRGKFLQEEIRRENQTPNFKWKLSHLKDEPVLDYLMVYPISSDGTIDHSKSWYLTYGLFLSDVSSQWENQGEDSPILIFPMVYAKRTHKGETLPFSNWRDLGSLIKDYPLGEIYLYPDVSYGSSEEIIQGVSSVYQRNMRTTPVLRRPFMRETQNDSII